MVTLVITNLTAEAIDMPELYITLGASGSTTEAATVTRSVAQLDSMPALQKLLADGDVSVVATNSSDNNDLMSMPMEQHGEVGSLDVSSTAVVTSDVDFADPFPLGVTPKVFLSVVAGAATAFKASAYVRSLDNTGFTIALDVTTGESGSVSAENPTMSPAENGVLLGPFTATLANVPLTSDAITLHWLESAVAKSATVTGTSTIGGADAANLAAASINRTTGALSVTFAALHPPDANSITVDYTQVKVASVSWSAVY